VNIVTFLADDEERFQRRIVYANIAGLKPAARSTAYWRCVAAFFATSARVNASEKHIFYTNRLPGISRTTVLDFLKEVGVEIRRLPFRRYRNPPHLCGRFMNNFYRLEVLQDLADAQTSDTSILLDSDCVWTRSAESITERFRDGRLHGIEVFKHPDL
jgi:hypothetical protein